MLIKMMKSVIAIAFICSLAACQKSPAKSCAGFCQSELECSMLSRTETNTCEQACTTHIKESSDRCTQAFTAYAQCYDDSPNCDAKNCYQAFKNFASSCDWYTEELAMR